MSVALEEKSGEKSLEFILQEQGMSLPNFVATHAMVVNILQCGPK